MVCSPAGHSVRAKPVLVGGQGGGTAWGGMCGGFSNLVQALGGTRNLPLLPSFPGKDKKCNKGQMYPSFSGNLAYTLFFFL